MDITFGIKTEAAAAYLDEMAELPPPNLPGGYEIQEIKVEDVEIESNSNSTMELDWIDDDDNADDLHNRLIMDPVDHDIQVNDTSTTKCSECGFIERQYIVTRRQKIMKQLHNQCIKRGLICSHCGLKYAVSIVTRQQTLNINRHKLCPQIN